MEDENDLKIFCKFKPVTSENLDHVLDIIKNHRLYMGTFTEMNDPMIGPNSDKNNDIDAVLCYAEEYGVPVEAMLREHMTYYSSSNFPNEKCCPERQ